MAVDLSRRELLTLAGWDEEFLSALATKKLTTGIECITTSQFFLLIQHLQETTEHSVYKQLEEILQCANPAFVFPRKWSNLNRSVRNNITKKIRLQAPVLEISSKLSPRENYYIGPICETVGLSRKNICDPKVCTIPGISLSVGCFYELCMFKNREKKCFHDLKRWVKKVEPDLDLSTDKLRYILKKIKEKYTILSKDKLSFELEMFKDQLFDKYVNTIKSDKMKQAKSEDLLKSQQNVLKLKKACQSLVSSQRQIEDKNHSLFTENITLKEVIRENNETFQHMEDTIENQRSKLTSMENIKHKNTKLEQNVSDLHKTLKSVRKESFYKRLQRKKKILHNKEKRMEIKNNKIREKVKNLKSKIKHSEYRLQKNKQKNHRVSNRLHYASNAKRFTEGKLMRKTVDLENHIQENIALKKEVINLKDENKILVNENHVLSTKDPDSNRYSANIRTCVMDLAGIGIPSNKISNVIQCVNTLYSNEKIQLPSRTTVQNICDEGHVIAKEQVSEVIMNSTSYDIFSDGTARDGEKNLNAGIHTNKKSMLLGYKHVAKEDSVTVAGVLKKIIYESASVQNKPVTNFLSNLNAMMSDRSSVMKKTNEILDDWRNSVLKDSTDVDENEIQKLNFFYCSAHVLLGFHNEIIKNFKTSTGNPVGRDLLPQFSKFKSNSEQPAVRLIRTASEVFGPRSDEKNGARQQWLAYLSLQKKTSKMIDYRGNRFNNLFTGAVSVMYHAKDISDYIENYFKNPNLKLQSVLADVISPDVMSQVAALALVSVYIAEPYWTLVNSDEHYLDFYKFVGPLNDRLSVWAEDSSSLLENDTDAVFEKYPHVIDDILLITAKSLPNIEENLCSICSAMLKVVNRQLKDHLPLGLYSTAPDDFNRRRSKHSKLTNIPSENLFGDLDFAQKQKPNATLRHHSSISMMKHNHTASWLREKSSIARNLLFIKARKTAKKLKETEQVYEKTVMQERKQMIIKIKQEKEMLKLKRRKEIKNIEQNVKKMGGVVRSLDDLENLLKMCKSVKVKKNSLRYQLLYCKLVLNISPVSSYSIQNTVLKLKHNLIETLKLHL